MRKRFNLGKIDYSGRGRKAYPVELEVELREDNFERPVFSVCGTVWNTKHTDCVCGGQCLDTIAEYRRDLLEAGTVGTFNFLYNMWKKYHLNDMHSGTPEQEAAIEKWKAEGNKYDYTEVCKYLESIGLYEVEYHGLEYNGMYKYGHGWLYQSIEPDDLNRIFKVMGIEKHN